MHQYLVTWARFEAHHLHKHSQAHENCTLPHVALRTAGPYIGLPITMAVSPIYAAPEVIRGERGNDEEQIDVCAHDVWSLGCLAFEMLTGSSLIDVGDAQNPKLAVMELHNNWVSISCLSIVCSGNIVSIDVATAYMPSFLMVHETCWENSVQAAAGVVVL